MSSRGRARRRGVYEEGQRAQTGNRRMEASYTVKEWIFPRIKELAFLGISALGSVGLTNLHHLDIAKAIIE